MLYVKLGLLLVLGGLVISLAGFMVFLSGKYFYKNFIKSSPPVAPAIETKHYDRMSQTGKYEIFGREELEDKYEK